VLGVDPSAIVRWCKLGIVLADGKRLRPAYVRTPNGFRITEEHLNEFLEAVKADRDKHPEAATPEPPPSKKRLKKMADELNRAGF
jgi:hypothetical protein